MFVVASIGLFCLRTQLQKESNMDDVKNTLVGNMIGMALVTAAALGIFGATLGMCAICTAGMILAGG